MIQYQREPLKFQRTSARPGLSPTDFEYWMDFIRKVLKVGTEFEINLPDPGSSIRHPDMEVCVNASKSCSADCANTEQCLTERHPQLCATRQTGTFLGEPYQCNAANDEDVTNCGNCHAWNLNCLGWRCAMFVPYCATCPFFLRIGDTVENVDIRHDAATVRAEMKELFDPSDHVGKVGKSGALRVVKDNSLIEGGGIEVPTVGRRVHWASFYKMCDDIIRPIAERGGYVNHRCGQHYHVLASYLPKSTVGGQDITELEYPVPEIILANLHQLYRRYEVAMFWLMSAGDKLQHLTRWARFRQSLWRFSALKSPMSKIQAEMSTAIVSMNENQKGKYASVSYEFCDFDNDGDCSRFHIENRIADGAMSAAAVTAWAMLCYALVLKAVRVSQYGIMETGSRSYMDRVKEIRPHLIDGEMRGWGDERHANTGGLEPFVPWLQGNAKELIQLLKPELSHLGPAYDILYSMSERPLSIRRSAGDSWEKIEEDLYGEYAALQARSSSGDDRMAIQEIIDLTSIYECGNLEEWEGEVAASLGKEVSDIQEIVRDLINSGEYRWSEPIGGVINA
jgi:hypothetical protein